MFQVIVGGAKIVLPEYSAEDVRELRKQLRMSREMLALTIGVSWNTIMRWETGKSKPLPLAQRVLHQLAGTLPGVVEEGAVGS